ncbi:hypothetical protein C1645_835480 [Glomus cerebriforme]|uniref:ATPase domain-containing protein n=1 Tax=Glomus cerebriforme TaxID=658196 RepID=A0A397SBY1_9GLOM|nr:hypothetical protein C1645_835480 [Glomus cerebriforme]
MVISGDKLSDFIDFVYPNLNDNSASSVDFMVSRAILALKNNNVEHNNGPISSKVIDAKVITGPQVDKSKISEWKSAVRALNHASEVYKAKHDKPMVIVYDNVSHLVYNNPKILDILQDDAKHSADDQKYIAVFVCSEGSVPRRMESRSAWSRAKQPVMEIGDFSREESMEYLIKKRNIKEVDAEKLYELVGGRIVELKDVADDFLAGQPLKISRSKS